MLLVTEAYFFAPDESLDVSYSIVYILFAFFHFFILKKITDCSILVNVIRFNSQYNFFKKIKKQ